MSEWGKVDSRYLREVSGLKRIFKVYNYDQKGAHLTDKNVREFMLSNLRAMKNTLTEIMGLAFRETDDSAKAIKKVRDDMDVAMDEIVSLNFWKFPESQMTLEKILKADMILLNNIEIMKKSVNIIYTQVLASKIGSNILVKAENLRKTLNEFRAVFLERSEAIRIKK